MKKINIAELLKDCPKGMELDCTMFEDVHFNSISDCGTFIRCYINYEDHRTSIWFNKYGGYSSLDKSKCVIFPKGKTSWEGFQRPFKDGDIISSLNTSIYIFTNRSTIVDGYFFAPCGLIADHKSENHHFKVGSISISVDNMRLATEEEKQKLFDAIKANGYKWNTETKTLEKLLMFKVGDKIRHKTHIRQGNVVTEIKDTHYILDDELALPFISQDEYELVPNKFDITTLKAFDKVLGRQDEYSYWIPSIFGFYNEEATIKPFICSDGLAYKYCVPYEKNEHLLGTTNDCDDFYKTWEK